MKILMFGEHTMLLSFLQRGFKSLGHDVHDSTTNSYESKQGIRMNSSSTSPNIHQAVNNSYPIVLARRALHRAKKIFVPLRSGKIVDEALSLIEDFHPDVALACQGGMSTGQSLELLNAFNEQSVPVFNYFTDPIPEDNINFLKTIPLYTGIFTYHRNHIPAWYWYGAQRVKYMPFASDSTLHIPKKPEPDHFDYYRSPISYLGTWKPYADLWPTFLIPYGLKIWGNQWYKLPANHELRSTWQGEGQGLFEEFSLICGASDIVFNVVQAFNGQGHSMKTFEIPACRGFALTNRTEEQLEFFPEDKACVYFSTAEELIDKTKFYLSHDQAREKIIEHGYEIAMKHRYQDRAQDMIRYFQELC